MSLVTPGDFKNAGIAEYMRKIDVMQQYTGKL